MATHSIYQVPRQKLSYVTARSDYWASKTLSKINVSNEPWALDDVALSNVRIIVTENVRFRMPSNEDARRLSRD